MKILPSPQYRYLYCPLLVKVESNSPKDLKVSVSTITDARLDHRVKFQSMFGDWISLSSLFVPATTSESIVW